MCLCDQKVAAINQESCGDHRPWVTSVRSRTDHCSPPQQDSQYPSASEDCSPLLKLVYVLVSRLALLDNGSHRVVMIEKQLYVMSCNHYQLKWKTIIVWRMMNC